MSFDFDDYYDIFYGTIWHQVSKSQFSRIKVNAYIIVASVHIPVVQKLGKSSRVVDLTRAYRGSERRHTAERIRASRLQTNPKVHSLRDLLGRDQILPKSFRMRLPYTSHRASAQIQPIGWCLLQVLRGVIKFSTNTYHMISCIQRLGNLRLYKLSRAFQYHKIMANPAHFITRR